MDMSQKTKTALSIALVAVVVGAYLLQFAYALPDIFNKFLPGGAEERTAENDPGKTLQAPFITNDAFQTTPREGLESLYGANDPLSMMGLDKPHRTPAELERWLVGAISETMNFSSVNYPEHIKSLTPKMDQTAIGQFHSFMSSGKVVSNMRQRGLRMSSHVESSPVALNSKGVVSGRYRWLYEVPLLLTFLPEDAKGYDERKDPVSQHVILTVQIGRVAKEKNQDELMLESFNIRPAF